MNEGLIVASINGNLEIVKYLVEKRENLYPEVLEYERKLKEHDDLKILEDDDSQNEVYSYNPKVLEYERKLKEYEDLESERKLEEKLEYYKSIENYYTSTDGFMRFSGGYYKSAYEEDVLIMLAIRNGHLEIVKYLVEEKGFDINATYMDENIFLTKAIEDGQLEIVKYLVENGVDINAKDKDGKTTLIKVVENRNLEIVKYLVDNGANVNAKNKDGKTALNLLFAIADDEIETIESLENEGDLSLIAYLHAYGGGKNKEEIIKETVEISKVLIEAGAK